MKTVLAALVMLGVVCAAPTDGVLAAQKENSDISLEALVADLALIDSPAPGLAGTATYSTFMAEDEHPAFVSGILGSPAPVVPPQMRELVRRGLTALPMLVRHLDDKRMTNLKIDNRFLTWREFGDEYDPRTPISHPPCDADCLDKKFKETRTFKGAYLVRVGDVCFVLIGQIVNRELTAVRYQPTGGLIVNSPLETRSLSERVRADWGKLDAQGHEASIRADIKAGDRMSLFWRAFTRLRFYYPNAYASLDGVDAKKRDAFETEEKRIRAAKP